MIDVTVKYSTKYNGTSDKYEVYHKKKHSDFPHFKSKYLLHMCISKIERLSTPQN